MKVSPGEYRSIEKAITYWKTQNLISDQQEGLLKSSIKPSGFDASSFATYIFITSIGCLIIALIGLFNLEFFIEIWKEIDQLIRVGILAVLALVAYAIGAYFKDDKRYQGFDFEMAMTVALFFSVAALIQLGLYLNLDIKHWQNLLILSSILSATAGYFILSKVLWLYGLLSLGCWLGSLTYYSPGQYSIYMSVPTRFIVVGIMMSSIAIILKDHNKSMRALFTPTLATGLCYTSIALLILSSYGNTEMNTSLPLSGSVWSLIFGVFCLAEIYLGIRLDINTLKNFGFVFLLILLYTKYFEYAWWFPSPLFFGILAISLWIIGYYSEKIFGIAAIKGVEQSRKND
ncbi:MAG: hypothetical protein VXZ73_02410 [Pseudomonadota bacterium]|nr:hypothetical protein [Pseudomonadota bacterium]